MRVVEVISPGTEVFLRVPGEFSAGQIAGIVIAVMLTNNGKFKYEVAWWKDGSRIETWLEHFELEVPDDVERVSVRMNKPERLN